MVDEVAKTQKIGDFIILDKIGQGGIGNEEEGRGFIRYRQ